MKEKKKKALAKANYIQGKSVLNRSQFLKALDVIIPWKQWMFLVEPYSPYSQEDERKLASLFRLYILQESLDIPDNSLSSVLCDSLSMLRFTGCKSEQEATDCLSDLPEFKSKLKNSGIDRTLADALSRYMKDEKLHLRKTSAGSVPVEPATEGGEEVVTAPVYYQRIMSKQDHLFSTLTAPIDAAGQMPSVPAALPGDQNRAHAPRAVHEEDVQRAPRTAQSPQKGAPLVFSDTNPPRENTSKNASAPVVLAQGGDLGGGWGRDESVQPAARRSRLWPVLALLLVIAIPVYLFGPSLFAQAKPWLSERFPNIRFLAAAPSPTSTPLPLAVVEATPVPTPLPTPRKSAYDAQNEIIRNKGLLNSQSASATVVTNEKTLQKKAAVTLDGLLDRNTMMGILDLVKQHDVDVSFFPSGIQAAEAPDVVSAIAKAGYRIGNYTLRGAPHMEQLPVEQMVEDFTSAQKIIQEVSGTAPMQIKGNALEYTETVLKAAGAVGIPEAVQTTAYLTFHSFKSYEEALAWVNRLAVGSIITIKLSGALDATEYQPKEVIDKPAIDLESNLEVEKLPLDQGTPSERVLQLVGWLLKAIDESDFSAESVQLRQDNQGKLAQLVQNIKTIQPAVGYAYYGSYGNTAEIEATLESLARIGGKGTFFVTQANITEAPDTIKKIAQAGHRVELAYSAASQDDFFKVSHELLSAGEKIQEMLGYQPRLVLQPSGTVTDNIKEVAASLGLMLVQQDLSFARTDVQGAASPQEVISAVYKNSNEAFQRGKIIGFRLGFFEDQSLLPSLIIALQRTRNIYSVADVYEMASNVQYLYNYPLTRAEILPEIYNRIHPGQLPVEPAELISLLKDRYIGNPGIFNSHHLPGFSYKERPLIDSKGKVKGAKDTVFLTFDDWGGDIGITKLLAVLKKHQVKATFFVRTEFVPNNPNLLRAIAMEGHEIASHTNTHYPLANDLLGNWHFVEISDEQAAILQADIIKSWEVLQSIVGDIRLENGHPALSLNFRPPTMAVGRKGLQTVFDLGFRYVVNGEYTSHDYAAKSAAELNKAFLKGIRSGSVVVMHFSDNSIYTADALDQYFTMMESGSVKKYTFARLSDYLKLSVATMDNSLLSNTEIMGGQPMIVVPPVSVTQPSVTSSPGIIAVP
ncbi:MAG: polysaccharide deacetylase family protein [Aminipila sp.]